MLDKSRTICYHIQALERAQQTNKSRRKKLEKDRKKVLTSEFRSDIIGKLSDEAPGAEDSKEHKIKFENL